MADGWIKLWRKANDCPALEQFDARGTWDWMLGAAAHKPIKVNFRGATIGLNRGQLALSVRALARQGGVSRKRMRVIMERFEADTMIQQQPIHGTVRGPGKGPVGILLTICQYDEYQRGEEWQGPAYGPGKGPVGAHQGPIEQERKNVRTEDLDSSLRSEPLSVEADIPRQMADIWNAELGDLLAKPRAIDKTRRQKLQARYRDSFSGSLEAWRGYCQRIRGSPWLTGDNDRGWKADMDFCLEPKRLNRILEGYYDQKGNGHGQQQISAEASFWSRHCASPEDPRGPDLECLDQPVITDGTPH